MEKKGADVRNTAGVELGSRSFAGSRGERIMSNIQRGEVDGETQHGS